MNLVIILVLSNHSPILQIKAIARITKAAFQEIIPTQAATKSNKQHPIYLPLTT